MKQKIRSAAHELGFELFGVASAEFAPHWTEFKIWLSRGRHGTMSYLVRHAELRKDARSLLPGARSAIVVGLNYSQPNPVRSGQPRIARYALGRDYHKVMRSKLRKLSVALEALAPGTECRICVDSAPILERDFAQAAGLGWRGKNTMLINSRRGSYFFLGILLTTLTVEPDAPAEGGCGTCRLCIDACPTGAIVFEEGRWQVDARSCISYLTIEHKGDIDRNLAAKLDGWTFGCDVCQEVCPFNQPRSGQPLRAQDTPHADFIALRDWPSLERLSMIGEEEWDQLTRGSPVRRAGLDGLRRNASLILAHRSTLPDRCTDEGQR